MTVGLILTSINCRVCRSFRNVRKCLSTVVVDKTPEWYMKIVLEWLS